MACQHAPILLYALHDYGPERDGDEEAWAAKLAKQGRGCGNQARPWTTLKGRRVRRWNLRRDLADRRT